MSCTGHVQGAHAQEFNESEINAFLFKLVVHSFTIQITLGSSKVGGIAVFSEQAIDSVRFFFLGTSSTTGLFCTWFRFGATSSIVGTEGIVLV